MADPRVERSKNLILETAREILGESGFRGVTIEALSERSGVAKTTIYRHWKNSAEVLVDSFAMMAKNGPVIDTGSLKVDLLTILNGMAATMHDRDWMTAATSMIEAAMHDSDFKRIHADFIKNSKKPIYNAIEKAVQRAELPADTDIDFLTAQLSGPLFYQCVVVHKPMSNLLVENLVDNVLLAAKIAK